MLRHTLKLTAEFLGSVITYPETRKITMATGTVKWFNANKGYGFIQPDDKSSDVFVHANALDRAGVSTLNDGQRVSYELATDKGKTSAANLKLLAA